MSDCVSVGDAARQVYDAMPSIGAPSSAISLLEEAVNTNPLARQALRFAAAQLYPANVLLPRTLEGLLLYAIGDPFDDCTWALEVRQFNLFPHMRMAILQHIVEWGSSMHFDVLVQHMRPAHCGMGGVYRTAADRALDAKDADRANPLLRLCAGQGVPVDADLLFGALHVLDSDCLRDYFKAVGCPMHRGLLDFLFHQQDFELSSSMFFDLLRKPAFADMVRALPHGYSVPCACWLALPADEVPLKVFGPLCDEFDTSDIFKGLHWDWNRRAVQLCQGWHEPRGGDMKQWHVSPVATLYYISRLRRLPPAGPHLRIALERVRAKFPEELKNLGMDEVFPAGAADHPENQDAKSKSVTHALQRLRMQDSRGQRLSCKDGMAALPVPMEVQACIAAYV